jgi:hypothetical protein
VRLAALALLERSGVVRPGDATWTELLDREDDPVSVRMAARACRSPYLMGIPDIAERVACPRGK